MKRIIGLFIILLCLCSAKAQQTEVRYLSGTGPDNTVKWDFWCSSGMNSQKWSKIEVPSCWEQQGFGGYTYGRYYIYKERENEKQLMPTENMIFAMNTAFIVTTLTFRILGKANR